MAPDTADEWPEMKCLQLIREFRKKPILWDQKNPLFYKKGMKPCAWIEIGRVLHMPADSCRHKMVILMSSFRREKAKVVNTSKYGKDPTAAYQSSWFGFKELSFLLDKESERKRKFMGILDDEDANETYIDEERTSPTAAAHLPSETLKRFNRNSFENHEQDMRHMKTSKAPKISVRDDNDLKVQSELGQQKHPTTSQHNEDEIKYFSNFIASKMMKYSETTKNAVQQAICEVIFKADQNYYEPTPKEHYVRSYDDPLNEPSGIVQLPSSSDGSIKLCYSDNE